MNKRVEENMTEFPCVVEHDASVLLAMELMEQHKIRHLPVVKSGDVVGVVSERDLKQAEILSDSMTLVVSDVMTSKPYCVPVGTSLADVAREMANHKYGCAVIIGLKQRIVGIFTTTDGMRVLSQLLDSKSGSELRDTTVEKWFSISTLLS